MPWNVEFGDEFKEEFKKLDPAVRTEILALAKILQDDGPRLGRPHADTLNDSKYKNMKELRFKAADGVWRVAFAFDPQQSGIILVAGDKSGVSEKRFYKSLIAKADKRYEEHLKSLSKSED